MADASAPRKSFRGLFRNWLSWAGIVLSASALFAFLLLVAIDQFAGHRNPYVGILAYVVAPGFFILGIVLIAIGVVLRWRAERRAVRAQAPSFSRLIYRGRGIEEYSPVFAGAVSLSCF